MKHYCTNSEKNRRKIKVKQKVTQKITTLLKTQGECIGMRNIRK